ncbi:hypothetical protein A4X06_0g6731 [Tilletia controversa]|uniref:Protein kinase domain-containing protein n=1 Tax=Tilletia controversa TaxID=13291 RepID=A0A8X7SUC7_9BASI|nr:hypothetical protein A4X06_0g6731 [Tilletia controversa]
MLLREAEILEELSQFDGFVKLVGKEEDPFANTITLYMEYCESGSLDGYIKDHLARNYQVAPREILLFAAQMLSALDRLHRPVVHAGGKLLFQGAALLHRDIKPANIMILGKAFKLGDVGIARTLEEGSLAGTRIGTAPKMRSRGPYFDYYVTSQLLRNSAEIPPELSHHFDDSALRTFGQWAQDWAPRSA